MPGRGVERGRSQASAVIRTEDDVRAEQQGHQEELERRQAAARARKQRMMELEAQRKKNAPPSQRELEKRRKAEEIRMNGATVRCARAGGSCRPADAPEWTVGLAQRASCWTSSWTT